MASKLPPTKIVELRTSLDAEPVITPDEKVLWATVEIVYASANSNPSVLIQVPLPWSESDTHSERRSMALRFARQLIDHACAIVLGDEQFTTSSTDFEGLTQETVYQRQPPTRPQPTLNENINPSFADEPDWGCLH